MAEDQNQLLKRLARKLDHLGWQLERLNLAEYVALFDNPGRFMWINFLAGVARGLGTAVGFTLLGALVLYILQQAFIRNLPFIGDLIAQLVMIVNQHTVP